MPPKRKKPTSPPKHPDPPPRQHYERSTKSRALGNGGLTRTRGSSYGINRYNRAHSSSDDAGSQRSNGADSQARDTDGNNEANADANAGVAALHGDDGDGGRSGGSLDRPTDGGQAGLRDVNDDASVDPSIHNSVVGLNIQDDDEGVDEVPHGDDELQQIVQIDLICNVEQVFDARNNAPNREVRGNVVGDDAGDLEDDDVLYEGVDRDLRPIVRHDLIDNVVEFFNQRNDEADAANGDFVEIDQEGQHLVENAIPLAQESVDDTSSNNDDDDQSANTPHVNNATGPTQETPTVTEGVTQASLQFDDNVGNNHETPTKSDINPNGDDATTPRSGSNSSFDSPVYSKTPSSSSPYSIEWVYAKTISEVLSKTDVLGKGDCGFIAALLGLIELREKYPTEFCSDPFIGLEYSWEGLKRFRKLLLSFFNHEYESLISKEHSPIQDWLGIPMVVYFGSERRCNAFRKRLWIDYFDQEDVDLYTMKPLPQWFHVEMICPLISKLFQVSVYVYATKSTEMDGDRKIIKPRFTSVFLYRPDHRGVMTTVSFGEVPKPHSDRCLLLYHSPGGAHFQQASLKPGTLSRLITSDNAIPSNLEKEGVEETQEEPPKKRRAMVQMHAPTLLSPTLDKHGNVTVRKDRKYFMHEETIVDGTTLVTWKNDEADEVPISSDQFHKLVVVMKTPDCSVSPFKVCWRKSTKKYDTTDKFRDIISNIDMVRCHLQIVMGNNRIAARYSSDVLNKSLKGDGDETQSILRAEKCDHKQDLSGNCIVKFRKARSKDLALYKAGSCAHGNTRNDVAGTCSTKVNMGFTANGINSLLSGESVKIKLVINVIGNCRHRKDFDYSWLCGSERESLIDEHMYDTCGNYADIRPARLYDKHNKNVNKESKSNLKSMGQTYEIKRAITKKRENELGLIGDDSLLNLTIADNKTRAMDMEYRNSNAHYMTSQGKVDDRLLGIVRNLDINQPDYGNRDTTPFRLLLFSYSAVDLFGRACESGRLCCNFDGTGASLKVPIQLTKGACLQLWLLSMSSSYMEGDDKDLNRTIRKNLSQFPVMQYISPLTSATDFKWCLERLVSAQKLIHGKKFRPLHFGTDCALQAMEGINHAYRFDGQAAITRRQWNNALFLAVRHCEDASWDVETSKVVIELLLTYAPVLLHWCYSHVMNAVSKWCDSKDRSSRFKKVVKKITTVMMESMRHGISTLDLDEMIIQIGLVKYLTQKAMIEVERYQAVTRRLRSSKSDCNTIGSHVSSFVATQKTRIATISRNNFIPMMTSNSMTAIAHIDKNLAGYLVDDVCDAAHEAELMMWSLHCSDNEGKELELMCTICYGIMPAIKDERFEDGRNAASLYDQEEERVPKFIHNVEVSTAFSDVSTSQQDVICVANPLYLPEVNDYIKKFIQYMLPTMSSASCRLAKHGRGAVMDNTNQGAEGGFKWLKDSTDYQQANKSLALYTLWSWNRNQTLASRYVTQLRSLGQIVYETNSRAVRHNARIDASNMKDPVNRTNVLFCKKKDKYTEMVITLDRVLSAVGYTESKAQFDHIMSEGNKLGFEGQFFVHEKTYNRWRGRVLSGKSITRNTKNSQAWELMEKVLVSLDCSHLEPVRNIVSSVRESGLAGDEDSEPVYLDDKAFNRVAPVEARADEDTGDLFDGLERLRKKWGLLLKPEELFIPRRLKDIVDTFCNKCVNDTNFGDSWACEGSRDVPVIRFTRKESEGEKEYTGHPMIECKNQRKFIGKNIPTRENSWHHRYSAVVTSIEKSRIFEIVDASIPEEIIPRKTDTRESLLGRLSESKYLDLAFSDFSDEPLTSLPGSMQAVRRTTGMVTKMPHVYSSELESGVEEGIGRKVISLRTYTHTEIPNNLWTCRPMKKKEFAQMLSVWSIAWPWCTQYTREHPPTGCQFLMYHKLLNKKMNDHRDNYDGYALKRLIEGKDPMVENATVRGCPNSQVPGSSVIIFTRGPCPMSFVFKYTNVEMNVTQNRKNYVTSPSYKMKLEDGWIAIMDPIDDLLMLHSVQFDEDDGCPDDYRMAYVYRNLEVSRDYYVETSTIRRDSMMMALKEKNVQLKGNKRRDIFT